MLTTLQIPPLTTHTYMYRVVLQNQDEDKHCVFCQQANEKRSIFKNSTTWYNELSGIIEADRGSYIYTVGRHSRRSRGLCVVSLSILYLHVTVLINELAHINLNLS